MWRSLVISSAVPPLFRCVLASLNEVVSVRRSVFFFMPKMNGFLYDNHLGGPTLNLLNVLVALGVLFMLDVLNVLNVLHELNVRNMPKDASSTCRLLLLLFFLSDRLLHGAVSSFHTIPFFCSS